ncbi:hypothetical protein R1sor_002556 [Riccia sorocarpa]|uniref:Reverse transcriptase domain-containing protein n=1 Tax=Riccia sorocarpa TaxID=122646 RepID=A0ABD3H334_9MARC
MGFDKHFIEIVQGFTCDGTTRVHINMAFTDDIRVERGIEPCHEFVHQLYVDDTGIYLAASRENFTKLQQILEKYEKATGAQINMSKTLIMPMGGSDTPDWVYQGVTPEGKPKKAMIAWRRVIRAKSLGGVGISSFVERANALQMRHVCAILEDKQTDWIRIARRIIQIKHRIGPQSTERSQWDVSDPLILSSAWRIPEVPTLDRLLCIWFKIKI